MSSTSRTVRANIVFAEKDQALREDVHRLGELVGEIVREQGGEALFDLVETARRAAIARREGDPSAYAELKTLLSALAPSTARDFIRAFSTYFQMVNTAEKVHRLRRRRAYQRESKTPQPYSFLDILQRLKARRRRRATRSSGCSAASSSSRCSPRCRPRSRAARCCARSRASRDASCG